jgi:hypothetical protein
MVERAADIAEAMEVHVKKLTANASRKQVGYCVFLIVVMIVMMSHIVFEFIILNKFRSYLFSSVLFATFTSHQIQSFLYSFSFSSFSYPV